MLRASGLFLTMTVRTGLDSLTASTAVSVTTIFTGVLMTNTVMAQRVALVAAGLIRVRAAVAPRRARIRG